MIFCRMLLLLSLLLEVKCGWVCAAAAEAAAAATEEFELPLLAMLAWLPIRVPRAFCTKVSDNNEENVIKLKDGGGAELVAWLRGELGGSVERDEFSLPIVAGG